MPDLDKNCLQRLPTPLIAAVHMHRSRGEGTGGLDPPPEKSQKSLRFVSYTGPDPLKNHKATKPEFNVGPPSAHQRNAISMTFHWRADDGLILVEFGSPLPSFTINKPTKKEEKTLSRSRVGPPLTKLSGSAQGAMH